MPTKKSIILFYLFIVVLTKTSFAGPIGIGTLSENCKVENVTLTSINSLPTSYNASKCVGVYGANDDSGGLSSPNPNIGQFEDGLLNGQDGFTGLEFITSEDLQALDPDGLKNDPGWLHLAHFDAEKMDTKYSEVGPAPGGDPSFKFNLGDFLTLSLTCNNDGDGENNLSDCKSMDWLLTEESDLFEELDTLLGSKGFDHLAFSIKAGSENSGGGFAVYDFNLKDIFANDSNSLDIYTPYEVGGTLNTADFDNHGVSHLNVWARDPLESLTVPEPSTLMLLAIAFIALRLRILGQ